MIPKHIILTKIVGTPHHNNFFTLSHTLDSQIGCSGPITVTQLT